MTTRKPGRYLFVPLPGLFINLVALAPIFFTLAVATGGYAWLDTAHRSHARFAADPTCTRTISTGTAPANGRACTIVGGTITGARIVPATSDDESPAYHFDFAASDGRRYDVLLENAGTSDVFDTTKQKLPERGVLELFDGGPAFIATPDGELSSQNDPSTGIVLSTGFTIVFGVVAVFGLAFSAAVWTFVRPKRTA